MDVQTVHLRDFKAVVDVVKVIGVHGLRAAEQFTLRTFFHFDLIICHYKGVGMHLGELAGKISEPLSKTEKIVIINSGNGPGGGASKLTGDVTQIVSQLPPVIESLTGIKFEKLLEQVPALRKAMEKGDSDKQA